MTCSKCGSVIPEGSTVCPRCAEQESLINEMDLELKRLLDDSGDRAMETTAPEANTAVNEKTIVAGATIHAAVKAAEKQKQASEAAAKKPAEADKPDGAEKTRPAASKAAAGTAAAAKHTASGSRNGKPAAAKTAAGSKKTGNRQKKDNKRLMTVLIAAIAAVVVALAVVGGITAYAMKYAKYDKILPNVYIAGIDVSGLTVDEAISVVVENYGDYETKSVEVQLPDQTLNITPAEGTISMNPELAVSEAYNYGRGNNSPFALARAIRAAKRTENNIDITTAVTVDTNSITELVQEAAATVTQPLVETSIEKNEDKHTITVTVGTEGKSLDTDTLNGLVCDAFVTGTYTPIEFDYTVEYPAAVTLDSVYESMTVEPKNAQYNPSSDKISDAQDGLLPDTELEEANAEIAAAQQGEELVFNFSKVKADYDADELEEVLFRDTLDTTTSDIVDTKRLANIEIACEKLDGTVVQPSAAFSFNDTLGTIGYAAGYVEADVYPGDDSDSMMGGGISQLASALYESCLGADLQITERHAHTYLPSFAKAGLDAYVKSGDSDFAFTNSSIYPIRIHASVSGETLTVYLEGTNENNYEIQLDSEAVSEDPYETDESADVIGFDGAEYHVTRTVLDKDGKEVRKDSTEDLDAMAGCGTSVYTRRDGTDYNAPETATADTDTDTSSNSSSNSYNYYNYVTPVPSTEPTTEPTTEPVTPTGGGESGGDTDGGDTSGGGDTGGGDTGGGGAAVEPIA